MTNTTAPAAPPAIAATGTLFDDDSSASALLEGLVSDDESPVDKAV